MQQPPPGQRFPEEGSTSATFAYGILVNIHSLIVAAKAFATFSTDARTLDLILSRRNRAVPILSTLTPPPRLSLQVLPLEVLLLVREQLLGLHLETTPNVFLEHHSDFFTGYDGSDVDWSECQCYDSDNSEFDPDDDEIECKCSKETKKARERTQMMFDPAKWDEKMWELHYDCDCDYCFSAIWSGKIFHREGYAECMTDACIGCEMFTVNQIRGLLRAYGLALYTPIYANANGWEVDARDFLAAIILPTHVRPPATTARLNAPPLPPPNSHFNAPHSYHGPVEPSIPENQQITTYHPSVFSVTSQDDLKFVKIVRELRLDVGRPDGAFVSSASVGAGKEAGDVSERSGKSGNSDKNSDGEVKPEVKPTFMLLHSVAPHFW